MTSEERARAQARYLHGEPVERTPVLLTLFRVVLLVAMFALFTSAAAMFLSHVHQNEFTGAWTFSAESEPR